MSTLEFVGKVGSCASQWDPRDEISKTAKRRGNVRLAGRQGSTESAISQLQVWSCAMKRRHGLERLFELPTWKFGLDPATFRGTTTLHAGGKDELVVTDSHFHRCILPSSAPADAD